MCLLSAFECRPNGERTAGREGRGEARGDWLLATGEPKTTYDRQRRERETRDEVQVEVEVKSVQKWQRTESICKYESDEYAMSMSTTTMSAESSSEARCVGVEHLAINDAR